MKRKYMVVVKANSETYATNAMRYGTPEEAMTAACELAARWLLVDSYAVVPSDTAPDSGKHYWTRSAIEKAAIGSIVDF